MKRYIHYLLLIFALWGGAGQTMVAQQIPISYGMLFRPGLWNPAKVGIKDFNRFHIAHQQRHLNGFGWKSIGEFLNFSSSPQGKHGTFGWGINLSNDIEHTENRVGLSGAMSAKLINRQNSKYTNLSVGISLGFINWNSNYDSIRVYDRNDELLANRSNFVELDAGMGLDFSYKKKNWDIELGVATMQMPGNFVSNPLPVALRLYPHLLGGANILYEVVHNIQLGPTAFYKNTILRQDTVITHGFLDVGLKANLIRQDLWLGAAYRLNRSAFTVGFGWQIYVSDSANHPNKNALVVGINGGLAYPFRQSPQFGPSAEIGLDILFGREFKYRKGNDSLKFVTGSFWLTDGNVNMHLEQRLAANAPIGLRGTTYVTNKNVTLTYEFPDGSLQYLGSTPEIKGDTLYDLGMEWVGVDGLLDGVSDEIVSEALTPNTLNVKNPEVLEPLAGLVFFELAALLKANEAEAFMDAEGVVYEGELGTNNADEDTLFLSVVYNNADTIVGVPLNHYISNLELACLKLYAMRKKLQYDLETKYGDTMAFLFEGEKVDAESILGKKPVIIRKPRILPNHPNQEVFQINQVKIKFSRKVGDILADQEEKEVDQDELLILDQPKKRKRENPGRFRDKR